MNVGVQITLRVEVDEAARFKAAAASAGLTLPMWLIQCARTVLELERQVLEDTP